MDAPDLADAPLSAACRSAPHFIGFTGHTKSGDHCIW
jgi:hypothetical protein